MSESLLISAVTTMTTHQISILAFTNISNICLGFPWWTQYLGISDYFLCLSWKSNMHPHNDYNRYNNYTNNRYRDSDLDLDWQWFSELMTQLTMTGQIAKIVS